MDLNIYPSVFDFRISMINKKDTYLSHAPFEPDGIKHLQELNLMAGLKTGF